MDIICKKCGKKSTLRNIEKYRGRKVKFRCLNAECKHVIEIQVEEEKEDLTTIVTIPFKQELKGILKNISKSNTDSKVYNLFNVMTLIGRQTTNSVADIQIENDHFISRSHCYIQFVNYKGYLIYDNESKNGVKVNDTKLRKEDKVYLKNKDIIQIGNTSFEFNYK